ncbi:DCC1-like thiol-disulfide oxidoreductase family protein [Streptomyces sp. NPDC096012]|uniref:thiol-disulfide oxidoreductase DCC family protein n=1 Tax=Streptomyces sp. NPDC096012 TaxID=3155684 RepID=UPI00336A234D
MTGVTNTADRGAASAPVRGLTVLYEAECALCTHLRRWLTRQSQLVPLEHVPAGSAEARGRFPGLDHRATLDEITVVGDRGQVYRGSRAWIVVLWALREHRPLAHRLAAPAGAVPARDAVLAAAKWRGAQGRGPGPARRRGRQVGGAPWRGAPWGGQAYGSADGWVYRPDSGWSHEPATCSDGARPSR